MQETLTEQNSHQEAMLNEKSRDVRDLETQVSKLILEINSLYVKDEENKELRRALKDLEEDRVQLEVESEEKLKSL